MEDTSPLLNKILNHDAQISLSAPTNMSQVQWIFSRIDQKTLNKKKSVQFHKIGTL